MTKAEAMTSILGIDPGLTTGALALCRDGQWTLLDMPIAGDAKRHEINGPELCRWLREHAPDYAFIEYAAARPGQGVSSMFRFGCCYGALKMALAACGVPYTTVAPTKWKPAVGILRGADKESARLRALELFPDQAANLMRRKDHARADAMLLAFYGLHNSGFMAAPPRAFVTAVINEMKEDSPDSKSTPHPNSL
jgi:crossover junction endodeoxyribonuclease RuvC